MRGAGQTLATTPDCFVEVHVEWHGPWGDSADGILDHFPNDRFHRFVASESEPDFTPLERSTHLLDRRFFLIAIAKPSGS